MPRIDPGLRREDEEEVSRVVKNMEPVPPGTVALVPELEVSDFGKSLEFYVGILGFSVLYDRPERPFAYLGLGAAHIMIEKGGTCIAEALSTLAPENWLYRIQTVTCCASPKAWELVGSQYAQSRERASAAADQYTI
jgi:hypothetical protein